MRKGVRLLSVPSTCVQFKPLSEDFAIDDIRLRPKGAAMNIQFPGEPNNTVKAACYQQHPTITFSGTMEPYYNNPAL